MRSLLVAGAILVTACSTATPSPSPSVSPPTPSPATPTPTPSEPSPSPSRVTASPGQVQLEVIVADLAQPLDLDPARDGSGRVFVAEQGGRIRIVVDGELIERPFLDIADRLTAGGEQGLLGIALHPAFPDDPRIFVDYTNLQGDTVVSSFELSGDPDVADPDSERIILEVGQPFGNHNGGALAFGPDGRLYIALGDGGSGGDPQGNGRRLDTLLAKILRIDVDVPPDQDPAYDIPEDNPWATGADGARPEIWLTGLRNPWRMRFDRATGDLWIGDVGQGEWEEIDVARNGIGGLDFGWATMEGSQCYDADDCDRTGLTLPLTEYDHEFGCAVIGGVVMRDPTQPALVGRYLFADACSGRFWTIESAGDTPREPTIVAETGRQVSAIGEDADGRILVTDLIAGELLRVTQ